MSQAQSNPTYKIIRGDDEKTFDSRDKWLDVQALLDGQNVEYETEIDGEPQQTDGGEVDANGDLDQDVEIIDHAPDDVDESTQTGLPDTDDEKTEDTTDDMNTSDDTNAMDTQRPDDASGTMDAADSTTEEGVADEVTGGEIPDTPPERNLSDDPVEWFGDIGEFTYTKNGETAINKKGLRVLQYWYDISITDSDVIVGPEDTDNQMCRVRAKAQMPDGRTAVAHGSAHVDRGDDSFLLVEMADTRAKSRVLLDITGMGAVAVSELENEP